MTQTGFYKLSINYINFLQQLGGKYSDGKSRPVYCCIQDMKFPDIYWAIPTSDVSHRPKAQMARIERFCSLPKEDIRSCYYHLGHTNREAIFKISNVLPVTSEYIEGEYISQGIHLVLKDKISIAEIERKLRRILLDEKLHPNKYEQHISSLYNELSHGASL